MSSASSSFFSSGLDQNTQNPFISQGDQSSKFEGPIESGFKFNFDPNLATKTISRFSASLNTANFTEKKLYEKKKEFHSVAIGELRACLEPQLLRSFEKTVEIKIQTEEFPALVVCEELAGLGWFSHLKIPLDSKINEIIFIFSVEKIDKKDENGFKNIYIPSV